MRKDGYTKRQTGMAKVIIAFRNFAKRLLKTKGNAVAQWLRRCATNRKVAGSIPDGVIGIFL